MHPPYSVPSAMYPAGSSSAATVADNWKRRRRQPGHALCQTELRFVGIYQVPPYIDPKMAKIPISFVIFNLLEPKRKRDQQRGKNLSKKKRGEEHQTFRSSLKKSV